MLNSQIGQWPLLLVAVASCLSATLADEPAPQIVLEDLRGPAGIAIQPGTGHVFVAEADGRAIRRVGLADMAETAIDGFGPSCPQTLFFEDDQRIAVGCSVKSSQPKQADLIARLAIYEIPAWGGKPVSADQPLRTWDPFENAIEFERGDFLHLVANPQWLLASHRSNDGQSWLVRGKRQKDGQFAVISPFVDTSELTKVRAIGGLTINRQGQLVIAQSGDAKAAADCLIAFLDSRHGSLLAVWPVDLLEVAGLAYSRTDQLYAIDLATVDPERAGIYRLDAAVSQQRPAVKAVQVLKLREIRGLAFGLDNVMYVTTGQGSLVRFLGPW